MQANREDHDLQIIRGKFERSQHACLIGVADTTLSKLTYQGTYFGPAIGHGDIFFYLLEIKI